VGQRPEPGWSPSFPAPHDDPTAATRCWNVEPLLHAEDGYVELEGSVLVAWTGNPTGGTPVTWTEWWRALSWLMDIPFLLFCDIWR